MKNFLVIYDYGTGGLWGSVQAESASQIQALYPELKVAEAPPKWMSQQEYLSILENECQDLHDQSKGILKAIVTGRKSS